MAYQNPPRAVKTETLPLEYRSIVLFDTLRPSQSKAIAAGLLDGVSVLVATPTASGKTVIAALAARRANLGGGKAIYVAPLKALASEKAREFVKLQFNSTLSVGDYDEEDSNLSEYDLIIVTPEKLDSLLRHTTPWIHNVSTFVFDEIHLLGDSSRGPTLEILITLVRSLVPSAQIVGLSATVQNAGEIAEWLDAKLVYDTWRPVELREAIQTQEGLVYKKQK